MANRDYSIAKLMEAERMKIDQFHRSLKVAEDSRGEEILAEEIRKYQITVGDLIECVQAIDDFINQYDIVDKQIISKMETLKSKIQQVCELFENFQDAINASEFIDNEDDA